MLLLLGALVTLVMSQAATAQIAVAVGAALLAAFLLADRLRFPSLLLVILLGLSGVIAAILLRDHVDVMAGAVAREATLTSRTAIWQDGLRVVADSPLIGHGYRSVWGRGDDTWFPQLEMTRLAGHAHNAYLQLATDLGVPVALIGCLYLLSAVYTGLQLHMCRRGSFALFTLIFFPMCIVINMAETWLFWPDNILWVVFVAVGISATRVLAGVERSRAQAPAMPDHHGRRLERGRGG